MMRANQVPCNFSESTISDKPARQVAKEAGRDMAGCFMSILSQDPEGVAPTLLKLLRYNAETIVKGLTGNSK